MQSAKRVVKKEPEVDVNKVMAGRRVPGVSANRTGVARNSGAGVVRSTQTSRSGAKPKYGIVEDYKPKFVRTEVKKRPLSKQEIRDTLIDAKQKKIVERPVEKVAKKAEALTEREPWASKAVVKKQSKLIKMPKVPFVNTDKIAKRPLSKNVYRKKIVAPKEEPSGPMTIIEKPEKDSKVGMVVAIILTIILGAAAGTVAFLLLPK